MDKADEILQAGDELDGPGAVTAQTRALGARQWSCC
jgi:hypothetical protein